jgi:hypothetical protein
MKMEETQEKKRQIPCTLPTKNQKYSRSVIRFIGGGNVIVGVIVIVGVTGDRSREVFLGGHEEGSD